MPDSQHVLLTDRPAAFPLPILRPIQVFPVNPLSPRSLLENDLKNAKDAIETLRLLEIEDREKLVDQYEMLAFEARQAQFRTKDRQWNGSVEIDERSAMVSAALNQLRARLKQIERAQANIDDMRSDLEDKALWSFIDEDSNSPSFRSDATGTEEPLSAAEVRHSKDSDCTVDEETGCCSQCGACHTLGGCSLCGGNAFHVDGCPAVIGGAA